MTFLQGSSMLRLSVRVGAIGLIVIMTSCDGEKNATVSCANLMKTQTDLGVLNLPNFGLGTVLDLDPATKRVNRPITVTPQQSQITQTNPEVESTTVVQNADLTVDVSADVPGTVKTDLQNSINKNTEFLLKNHFRKEIPDPIGLINADSNALNRLANTEGHIIFIVSGLIMAKNFSIKLANAVTTGGDVNVMKVGDFKFKVAYQCDSRLEQIASAGGAVLWRGTQAKFDKASGKLIPDTSAVTLKDYDFTIALQ